MKISITGASGFLGKAIANKLIAKGHSVIAWIRDKEKLPGFDARHFDLNKPDEIYLNDSDIVIHCAAHIPKSYEDPDEATKCLIDNGIATLELLRMSERASIKKFIYISSGTIYDPNIWIANESSSAYPSMRATYYLTSKLVGDIFVDHYRSKINTVIIRPSYIYGPGMKQVGLLPRLISKIKSNELQPGDVANYEIDMVHIDDVVWMAVESINNPDILGTFNIGSGMEITTFQIAKMLASILDQKIFNDPPPKSNGHAMLDISSASVFGYSPTSLESGLRSYMDSLGIIV